MDISDKLTITGIALTFITTISGWVFTYIKQRAILDIQTKAQKEITELQEELTFRRKQQLTILTDIYDYLDELEMWFENGREIYFEAVTLQPMDVIELTEFFKSNKERIPQKIKDIDHYQEEIKKSREIHQKSREFRSIAPRLFYLAKIFDPEYPKREKWHWGSQDMPKDLPQIISAFEDEIYDQINELIGIPREKPKVQEQFHLLHEAGIREITRLKQYYTSHKFNLETN